MTMIKIMKTSTIFPMTVLAGLLTANAHAQTSKVTISTSKAKKVSRMIYGWHYEEIGNIGDGGLYAEMVRARGQSR